MKRTLWRKKPWKTLVKAKSPQERKIKLRSIKAIKLELWGLFSQFIRRRDKGVCKTCGKRGHWKEFDCGHYKHNSERNMSLGGNELWWFEKNFASQCFACNRMRSGNLSEFAIYLEATYGKGVLQEIHAKYLTPKKWTRQEIEDKIKHYEKLVRD